MPPLIWYPVAKLTNSPRYRIMKARKTMKNQALIQEVISQISQRFAPKIPDIKKVRLSYTSVISHSCLIALLPGYRNPSGKGVHRASGRIQGQLRIRCLISTNLPHHVFSCPRLSLSSSSFVGRALPYYMYHNALIYILETQFEWIADVALGGRMKPFVPTASEGTREVQGVFYMARPGWISPRSIVPSLLPVRTGIEALDSYAMRPYLKTY